MPRPLPAPTVKVDWRLNEEDVAFLRARYPGRVNPIMREVIAAFVARLREKERARLKA